MTFSEEQKQQFRTHGYLIVPHFFDATEVAAMQTEIERFKAEGKLRNVSTDGDGQTHSSTKMNLQLCPMSPHSDLFKTLPFAPKVREAISQLIGDPVVLHLDQVFLKPGKHGAGTNWHQDNAYFHIPDPLKGTAMWIAVHDATLENGTLHVIPDSHKQQFEHTRDGDSDHHVRCYPPEETAVPVLVDAGGVVFFAYGVAHATFANKTDKDRAGAAFHFLNGDAIPDNYFSKPDGSFYAGHPYITGSEYDGGVTEYGADLSGHWPESVEKTKAWAPA